MFCCNMIGDCCYFCSKCCDENVEEKAKISIGDKASPMLLSKSLVRRDYDIISSSGIGKSDVQQTERYPTNEESNVVNIPFQLSHDKAFKYLTIKVLHHKRVADRFDICLKNPKVYKTYKSLFNDIKVFKDVTEGELRKSKLIFKFYDRKIMNETKRLGEVIYPLQILLAIGLEDSKRFLQSELSLTLREPNKTPPGTLEISFCFQAHEKTLTVIILKGEKLLPDIENTLNPYCSLDLYKSGKKSTSNKTTVIYDSFNPEWNETFVFHTKDLRTTSLRVYLYNENDSEKLIVGKLIFPASSSSLETDHWNKATWLYDEAHVMWHNFHPC